MCTNTILRNGYRAYSLKVIITLDEVNTGENRFVCDSVGTGTTY